MQPLPQDISSFCTFYIVRHGQTEWNLAHKVQGQTDIPLNDEGRIQAKQTGELLSNIDFSAVFSSDLFRAKETAEIIVLKKQLAVSTTRLLRERNFGRLEGTKFHELAEIDAFIDQLSEKEKKTYKAYPEMENDEEILSRFITFLRETAVLYPNKNILVATHGGMMRTLLIHLGFGTYKTFNHDKKIYNGAYLKLLSDGVDFFIAETHGIDQAA